MVIHNPKVGGSIPPPATNGVNSLQRQAPAAVLLLWGLLCRSAFAVAQALLLRVATPRRSRACNARMFE